MGSGNSQPLPQVVNDRLAAAAFSSKTYDDEGVEVITKQPTAKQEIQQLVHEVVRRNARDQVLPSRDALLYSRTLNEEERKSIAGFKYCVPVGCIGFKYCVCAKFILCCDGNCLWFPCCIMGVSPPFYGQVCMSCEETGDNSWVNRDKNGIKTGEIVLVDSEEGTIAFYGTRCCSEELEEKPQCYCYKW